MRLGKPQRALALLKRLASLCEKNTSDGTQFGRHDVVLNEGLENVGIRYGYMF